MSTVPHYLVSTDLHDRAAFVSGTTRVKGKRFAVYNQVPLGELEQYFDRTITLNELYDDQTFLTFLALVDADTTLFYIDMGIDYCSFKADYIRPYLRLHPMYQQAGATYIIDGMAFWNSEKAVYRPFLYIREDVLGSTVQEFYNTGTYADYTGNRVENWVEKVRPHLDLRTRPMAVTTVRYEPTPAELRAYEALKKKLILDLKYPKAKVVRMLLDFVDQSASKRKAMSKKPDGRYHVAQRCAIAHRHAEAHPDARAR